MRNSIFLRRSIEVVIFWDGGSRATETSVSIHIITRHSNSENHDFYSSPWKSRTMHQESRCYEGSI